MNNDKNKLAFVCISVFAIVIIIISLVNKTFEDKRPNMTDIPSESWVFNKKLVKLSEEYLLDKKDNKGQLAFSEYYIKTAEKGFSILIKDQNDKELKSEIIENETREEVEGDIILVTDYTIPFEIPKEIYYIKCYLTRDGITYKFTIDYRDFKIANL